jgi:hypothetical protein
VQQLTQSLLVLVAQRFQRISLTLVMMVWMVALHNLLIIFLRAVEVAVHRHLILREQLGGSTQDIMVVLVVALVVELPDQHLGGLVVQELLG